jgi:hypothetical protein
VALQPGSDVLCCLISYAAAEVFLCGDADDIAERFFVGYEVNMEELASISDVVMIAYP